MSATLRFLNSDGSEVITTLSEGNIDSPGDSANEKVLVENFGDLDAQEVTITLVQVGTNDGDDYAELAEDMSGSPGTFSTDPLELGTIAALERVPFWTRVELPTGLTADANPRRYDIKATALTL